MTAHEITNIKGIREEKMIMQKMRYILLVCKNSLGKYIWKTPKVKTIDETLDYIIETKSSVSRFGDGEFAVIQGRSNGFQDENQELGDRLARILKSEREGYIVCIPDVFGKLDFMKEKSKEFHIGLLNLERREWLNLLNLEKVYGNAFFTRCYNMFEDKSSCPRWFEKNKKIWENQHVLLVEGEKSRLGVGNDLFENTGSVKRILCPSENAYEKYDEILKEILKYGKDRLILLALGMTATVLAWELSGQTVRKLS